MAKLLSPLIAALLFSAGAYSQTTSIYTSTRTSACRTIESSSEGTGSYVGECKGPLGYKVQVVEGDIRQTINVIMPSRKKFELNFWSFFGSFSSVGEKIEWRIADGSPAALIVRYNVSDPENSAKTTSYLMVAKIEKSAVCVTDIAAPGPKQNEQARRMADSAGGKPCKRSE